MDCTVFKCFSFLFLFAKIQFAYNCTLSLLLSLPLSLLSLVDCRTGWR